MEDRTQFSGLTVGIAEDEPIESDAMRKFIEDHFPKVRVIWQEANGRDALERIKTQEPDLMIIDINMPVMSGLELCRKLQEQQYPGVMIINTAYDNFAYAREAIRLRVYDYIVKPMEDEELLDTLKNGLAEVCRRKERRTEDRRETDYHSLQQYTFSMLLQGDAGAGMLKDFLKLLGWPMRDQLNAWIFFLHSADETGEEQLRDLDRLIQNLSQAGCLVVADCINSDSWCAVTMLSENISAPRWYTLARAMGHLLKMCAPGEIVVNGPCDTCEEILSCCRQEMRSGGGTYQQENDGLSLPRRTWCGIRRKDTKYYENLLERYQRERSMGKIRSLIAGVREQGVEDMHSSVGWELCDILCETSARIWPVRLLEPFWLQLAQMQTEPYRWMDAYLEYCKELPIPETGDLIGTVLEWMEQDFSGDLTQSGVAERFGMDPGAFSRYFKKKTGRNFSDVLTQIRMEHAERLMHSDPSITLEKLCAECGLSSKAYFSEVFKKWKGMTITQYIKSIAQN